MMTPATIQALYESGKTVKEIADLDGRSLQAIRKILIEAGVTFRPKGRRPNPQRHQEIMDAISERSTTPNISFRAIGKRFGISGAAVFNHLTRGKNP